MDNHHKAHYGIAGALALALGYGAAQLHGAASVADLPPSYRLSAGSLAAVPFGAHDYVVYVAPGSGEAPYAISRAIRGAGGGARTEPDMIPHEGVWVAPDTPEGRALADAISKAIGEPVAVGNYEAGEKAYGTPFQIGVGTPKH